MGYVLPCPETGRIARQWVTTPGPFALFTAVVGGLGLDAPSTARHPDAHLAPDVVEAGQHIRFPEEQP